MKVRFQADADLNENILLGVIRREPLVDFQSSVLANLNKLNDGLVLALASKESRLLVTHDRRTMPHHFAKFISNQTSFGVLIIPQHLPISQVLEDLLLIWFASSQEDWMNRIASLPL